MPSNIKVKIKGLIRQSKNIQRKIADERDNLRKIQQDIEDVLSSLDSGCDELKVANEDLERGIDTISQYL